MRSVKPGILIAPARSPDDFVDAAALFRAYQVGLGLDLSYQDFAAEIATLPGRYVPPGGALLLALDLAGERLGCAALRPMDRPERCEMKRLYVAPAGRGHGLGRRLVTALIAEARRIGYRDMWLDTLPTMAAAQQIYAATGFEPAGAYYESPVAGTVFLRLRLDR